MPAALFPSPDQRRKKGSRHSRIPAEAGDEFDETNGADKKENDDDDDGDEDGDDEETGGGGNGVEGKHPLRDRNNATRGRHGGNAKRQTKGVPTTAATRSEESLMAAEGGTEDTESETGGDIEAATRAPARPLNFGVGAVDISDSNRRENGGSGRNDGVVLELPPIEEDRLYARDLMGPETEVRTEL